MDVCDDKLCICCRQVYLELRELCWLITGGSEGCISQEQLPHWVHCNPTQISVGDGCHVLRSTLGGMRAFGNPHLQKLGT